MLACVCACVCAGEICLELTDSVKVSATASSSKDSGVLDITESRKWISKCFCLFLSFFSLSGYLVPEMWEPVQLQQHVFRIPLRLTELLSRKGSESSILNSPIPPLMTPFRGTVSLA